MPDIEPFCWLQLDDLFARYQDGDEHGWDTEFAWLRANHAERLAVLRESIERDGITTPIYIGDDNRVWDGHHRLCVAYDLGLPDVPITTIPPDLETT